MSPKASPPNASPQERKSPEEAAPSTASIAGAGVIANAEFEAGVTAKAPRGDDTGGPSRKTVVVRPSQADIDAGVATSVREYMEALVPSVQEDLTAFLKQRSGFTGTLADSPPLEISAGAQKSLKNFREPWNMQSCLESLNSTQIYEASGNVFWLDVLGTKFGDLELHDADVTWRRLLEDGAALWSEEALLSSCDEAQYRRFIFPGYLPAVLANTSHVESTLKSGACHFSRLCVLGGHSIIYSWYQALADALAGGVDSRVWKLYEAGMTATIRLRLTTSHTQVPTDAHVCSETIRASHMAGSCDLFNFVKRVATIPEVVHKGTSAEKMRKVLDGLGIQYKCKAVDKTVAMGIMALLPVVGDDRCMKSLAPLRECFPKSHK